MTSQPAVTKPATQQPRPATDPQLRATILLLAATAGTRAASERYGVGEGTIRSWKARDRRKREIVAPGAGSLSTAATRPHRSPSVPSTFTGRCSLLPHG